MVSFDISTPDSTYPPKLATSVIRNIKLTEVLPPVPPLIQYRAFIQSSIRPSVGSSSKTLVFSKNNIFDIPTEKRENVSINFSPQLDDTKYTIDEQIPFRMVTLNGSVTMDLCGNITTNFNNSPFGFTLNNSLNFPPDFYFTHYFSTLFNTKLRAQLSSNVLSNIQDTLDVVSTQDRIVFPNISSNTITVTTTITNGTDVSDSDIQYFDVSASNVVQNSDKTQIVTTITNTSSTNFITMYLNLDEILDKVIQRYNASYTAYEFNTFANFSAQYLVNYLNITSTNPTNPVEALKYFIMGGDYTASDITSLSTALFIQNNNLSSSISEFQITASDFYTYGYISEIVSGPPSTFVTLSRPYYKPSDLLGIFSKATIISAFSQDVRSIYEYGTQSATVKITSEDLNTIGNILPQTIVDDLNENNVNIAPSNGGVETQEFYYRNGGISNSDMKDYLFTANYTVAEIIDETSYRVAAGAGENDTSFVLLDFGNHGSYLPSALSSRFTVSELIAVFPIQTLYIDNFTAIQLHIDGNIDIDEMFSGISFESHSSYSSYSSVEDAEKYYIFSGSYEILELIDAYDDDTTRNSITVDDFSKYGYIGDPFRAQRPLETLPKTSKSLYYTPDELRQEKVLKAFNTPLTLGSFISSISQNHTIPDTTGFTLTDLYTYNFTAREMNIDGSVPISDVINNITYNFNPTSANGYGKFGSSYTYDISYVLQGYPLKTFATSEGFIPVLNFMGIDNKADSGTLLLPDISASSQGIPAQSAVTLTHTFNTTQQNNTLVNFDSNFTALNRYAEVFTLGNGDLTLIQNSNTEFRYFPAIQLKTVGGYSISNILGNGYTVPELPLSIYTAQELFDAGVQLTRSILDLFPDIKELINAGYTYADIAYAKGQPLTARAIIGLDADICELNTFQNVERTWQRYRTPEIPDGFTLDALQMRRKAETLKHTSNAIQDTDREKLTNILKGRRNNCTRGLTFTSNKIGNTNSNVLNLQQTGQTLTLPTNTQGVVSNPPYHSNVPGNRPLFLNPNTPLFNYTRKYTYIGSDDKNNT
jgi:hypothetical protein